MSGCVLLLPSMQSGAAEKNKQLHCWLQFLLPRHGLAEGGVVVHEEPTEQSKSSCHSHTCSKLVKIIFDTRGEGEGGYVASRTSAEGDKTRRQS